PLASPALVRSRPFGRAGAPQSSDCTTSRPVGPSTTWSSLAGSVTGAEASRAQVSFPYPVATSCQIVNADPRSASNVAVASSAWASASARRISRGAEAISFSSYGSGTGTPRPTHSRNSVRYRPRDQPPGCPCDRALLGARVPPLVVPAVHTRRPLVRHGRIGA